MPTLENEASQGNARSRSTPTAARTLRSASHPIVGWMIVLSLMCTEAVAMTLDEALVETYGDCYDPTGSNCSCTDIDLSSSGLWGTIPSALSACTDINNQLCVFSALSSCTMIDQTLVQATPAQTSNPSSENSSEPHRRSLIIVADCSVARPPLCPRSQETRPKQSQRHDTVRAQQPHKPGLPVRPRSGAPRHRRAADDDGKDHRPTFGAILRAPSSHV